jgi:N6-L-threonylcarbamoyladenine synthase
MYTKDYDFSFSGLKTAVLYEFKKQSLKIRKSKTYIWMMCAEIQQAIIDVLIHKTIKAAKNFKVKSIILGGGVAANEELRTQFLSKVNYQLPNVKLSVPPKNLCTDNAAMVAATAFFQRKKSIENWQKIKADANLRVR